MTLDTFAEHVGRLTGRPGRRTRQNRWMTRCPAHDDRSPSLSITEGGDGRLMVHCFAGCRTSDILKILGLGWDALFSDGSAPSLAEAARVRRDRERAAQREKAERAARRALIDRAMKLRRIVNSVGGKLAHIPDGAAEGDALVRLFHQACDKLHEAEQAAEL